MRTWSVMDPRYTHNRCQRAPVVVQTCCDGHVVDPQCLAKAQCGPHTNSWLLEHVVPDRDCHTSEQLLLLCHVPVDSMYQDSHPLPETVAALLAVSTLSLDIQLLELSP